MPGRVPVGVVRIAFAVAVIAASVTACSGPATPGGSRATAAQASYYLALGDSLSQGVQPDAAGVSVETGQGYADQVYAALHPGHPALRLVKLGCPGETTGTMINGGICRYPGGSQLAAAVAFLRAHRGHVFLVTIDIGANDPEECGSWASLSKVTSCLITGIPHVVTNLATIMGRLRAAADPGVRIVGMNYYVPALAEWREGTTGQAIARLSERLAVGYNDLLEQAYTRSGARVGVPDHRDRCRTVPCVSRSDPSPQQGQMLDVAAAAVPLTLRPGHHEPAQAQRPWAANQRS